MLLRGTTLASAVRGGLGVVLFAGLAMGAIKHWLHQIQLEEGHEPLASTVLPPAGGGLAGIEAKPAAVVVGAPLVGPLDPVEAWLGQPIRWLV